MEVLVVGVPYHWCQMTGSLWSFSRSLVGPVPLISASMTVRKRRKWNTSASMTWYGKAYFFNKRALMKMLVAPPPSVPAEFS